MPGNPEGKKRQQAKTRDQLATELAAEISPLFEKDQVIELRALGVKTGHYRPHVEAGFFDTDHLYELAVAALTVTPNAKGLYCTINPLNPDILARRCYRIDWAEEGELSKDKNIIARRRLLIDVDPIRDPHISATDEEKRHAHDVILNVREFLRSRSWPDPVLVDSGNGHHLLYSVDLRADDGGIVERILKALSKRFNNDFVKIDEAVFNSARICKLPGTLARKGDDTPTRPHRRAELLEVPGR